MSNHNINGDIWKPTTEEAFAKPTPYETLFQLWKTVTVFGGPSIGCVVLLIDVSINKEPMLSAIAGTGWVLLGLCLNAGVNRDSAYQIETQLIEKHIIRGRDSAYRETYY